MKKVIEIEGMHCQNCSAKVQKALAALPGVVSAAVSHETKEAVVECEDFVTDDMLTSTVNGTGFKAVAIK